MRAELAETLLAKVMNWSEEEKARERPILQDLRAISMTNISNTRRDGALSKA